MSAITRHSQEGIVESSLASFILNADYIIVNVLSYCNLFQGRLIKLAVQDHSSDCDVDSQDSGIMDTGLQMKRFQFQGYDMHNDEIDKENNCSRLTKNSEIGSLMVESKQIQYRY